MRLDGCFITNAVSRGGNSTNSVVCLLTSRLNHSCLPNVSHCWASPYERIVALRDIPKNTELCTSYIDLKAKRNDRREELMYKYRFECCCEACSLNGKALDASDRRRQMMNVLHSLIQDAGQYDPKKGLQLVERMLDTLREEGLFDNAHSCCYFYEAYQFACAMKNLQIAKKYIKDAYDATVILEGKNSDEAKNMERYLKKPKSHFC